MKLFAGKKPVPAARTQLRDTRRHPFGMFDGYVPLGGGDGQDYGEGGGG